MVANVYLNESLQSEYFCVYQTVSLIKLAYECIAVADVSDHPAKNQNVFCPQQHICCLNHFNRGCLCAWQLSISCYLMYRNTQHFSQCTECYVIFMSNGGRFFSIVYQGAGDYRTVRCGYANTDAEE